MARVLFTFSTSARYSVKFFSHSNLPTMKTYLKFPPVAVLILLLTFTACKDDDDDNDEPAPKTRTEMLTAKNWTRTSVTITPAIDYDGNGTQENDLTPYIPTCDLDDFYKFNSNTSFTREEGPSKCDANDPQVVYTGTWTWNSDETILTITPLGGETQEAKVTTLNDTEMVWNITFSSGGVNYTEIHTLN